MSNTHLLFKTSPVPTLFSITVKLIILVGTIISAQPLLFIPLLLILVFISNPVRHRYFLYPDIRVINIHQDKKFGNPLGTINLSGISSDKIFTKQSIPGKIFNYATFLIEYEDGYYYEIKNIGNAKKFSENLSTPE